MCISTDLHHTRYGAIEEELFSVLATFYSVGLKHVAIAEVQITDVSVDGLAQGPHIDVTAEAMQLEEALRAFSN